MSYYNWVHSLHLFWISFCELFWPWPLAVFAYKPCQRINQAKKDRECRVAKGQAQVSSGRADHCPDIKEQHGAPLLNIRHDVEDRDGVELFGFESVQGVDDGVVVKVGDAQDDVGLVASRSAAGLVKILPRKIQQLVEILGRGVKVAANFATVEELHVDETWN